MEETFLVAPVIMTLTQLGKHRRCTVPGGRQKNRDPYGSHRHTMEPMGSYEFTRRHSPAIGADGDMP